MSRNREAISPGSVWYNKQMDKRTRRALGLRREQVLNPEMRQAYREELERQKELYRREKEQKRQLNEGPAPDAPPKSRPKRKEEILHRNLAWGREHREDSDEELLAYLSGASRELGHIPARREVLGGHYIARRFCGWNVALLLSGLPLERSQMPGKEAVEKYRRRRAEAAP